MSLDELTKISYEFADAMIKSRSIV